ncbi:MAG: bifunctional (p)ppGpp synthetase/guanosine-3',5'-bis(diphosphate) 3'-pyrophosphohydrolase [Magnetococcales bacterium]|nr:bifunctional (p)ppGpp synthetase/guanosine-3',5'-bis(diphosphate) 3'-pyrophosphohydrolase [Magnetococcales bacterium]MBF0150446.1 bifunctional (p)ppGpp synthetase/guanosine-3',5'-bis(diphosphate) 3'-pyrophosphohydrolase [Magnetococcales bacterium]MBF0172763.1 bifunctional (p)ppGpp synthetase/guanosine-3',5'-bis(diphosphate) 3'-pyrophosphohydrolase [Magnetococcales bacterium]MBF0347481.1 bifunctional (p)ppGpp synthetase/guanosine-3',5'-bis(diphosphate) 3'-pyrophosphohydrolase [Magnetococcales 
MWLDLVNRILTYHPKADRNFLDRLGRFLEGLTEKPEVSACRGSVSCQPLEVAKVLVDLRMDTASIAAGILVSGVETGLLTLDQARADFGEDVVFLVEGLTRISHVSARAKTEVNAEDLRRMILAMAKDIRVILVRLAICLRRMHHAVIDKTRVEPRMTAEILDIYAPIAHRLGIYWIKNELEDLAFQLKDPESFHSLKERVAKRRKGGENVVRKVISFLRKMLKKHGIKGQVFGREKHLYSIHNKLLGKGVTLEELYDVIAYRILVNNQSDCYRVLGMVHSEMRPIPGRFKDYIALPKSNGYQSLHTVVFGPYGNRIEIQIRTRTMHEVAESGVAAHWSYKEGGLSTREDSQATGYAWLKRLLEVHQNADDSGQFLDNVKVDLFPEEIYLFTPEGDIITLPRGATPVDFAYAVHSEVGDHCQGAKVNGRLVPLKTPLATGDSVVILTGKNHAPNPAWLRFVVTGRAKYRINRWIKQQNREQAMMLGREILLREARKGGVAQQAINEKKIRQWALDFGLKNGDEFLLKLGMSMITPSVLARRLFPQSDPVRDDRLLKSSKGGGGKVRGGEGRGPSLQLAGLLPRMAVMVARCCSPVPGDSIVGIVHTGKGISIHATGCPNLEVLAGQPERWIEDIDWPEIAEKLHVSRLRIMARNRRDVLSLVSHVVLGAKSTVVKMKMQDRDRDPFILICDVEVTGLDHLRVLMQAISALEVVLSVERIKG